MGFQNTSFIQLVRDPLVQRQFRFRRKSYSGSKVTNFAMSNVTAVLPGKIEDIINVLLLENNARCRDTRHVGQEYSDVLTTLFILAWIQVVPSLLAIIQYFSSFFSKQRKIICCNEKWKKAKVEADLASDVSTDEGGYRKRKRSKGRMCCIVFLRNASIFLNYLIVVAAFVAGVMMIYVYLSENDTEVENIKNTFYTFRATVIFYLILAILGIFYARLNLQLLIYFLSVVWFIIFFVSAYLGFFYTWDDCGRDINEYINDNDF